MKLGYVAEDKELLQLDFIDFTHSSTAFIPF